MVFFVDQWVSHHFFAARGGEVAFATTREFLAQRKANGKSNLVRFIKRSLSSPCTPQVAAAMENGADLQEARLGSVNYQVRVERENLGSFNVPSFVRVRVNLSVYQASDQKLHSSFLQETFKHSGLNWLTGNFG
jgi:hypothetical protein